MNVDTKIVIRCMAGSGIMGGGAEPLIQKVSYNTWVTGVANTDLAVWTAIPVPVVFVLFLIGQTLLMEQILF